MKREKDVKGKGKSSVERRLERATTVSMKSIYDDNQRIYRHTLPLCYLLLVNE